MKKLFIALLLLPIAAASYCQLISKVVNVKEVKRIETILSADDMQGRKAFTVGSQKAADFIANEFKKIGLGYLEGINSYQQKFTVVKPKSISTSASFNGTVIAADKVIAITSVSELKITHQSGFELVKLNAGEDFFGRANEFVSQDKNFLVFVDTSFTKYFRRLQYFKQHVIKSDRSVVFVLGNYENNNFEIRTRDEITEVQAANVVGVLPGKSKKQEFVIFSGHYDHLGIGKADGNDSIYNGANDDASGITAIISIAKYFKSVRNSQRTLIFAAFTAEEIGGFGSRYFSKQLSPENVMAMFNIEMIGTESKWGKNSGYITGYEKTDMGKILQKNLQGSSFTFYPDPYTEENLFYRSDNATLARLGVPAHTISTSKMDNEPNYHKVSDEIETLDIPNMTQIIKSIIISAKSIISGKDTPSRVERNELLK
jgi:Zn-dependent M28 family amino/carboxypeptidase